MLKNVLERFTDSARRVLAFAQEEARLLDHGYVGTEHLLLGLLRDAEFAAAITLQGMGVSFEQTRREVEATVGRGKHEPTGHIPFTPRAKKVLELALREALQMDSDVIGTEHLLLGLVREADGVAAVVLVRLGIDPLEVRAEVLRLRGEGVGTGMTETGGVTGPRFSFPAAGVTGRGRPRAKRDAEVLLDRLAVIESKLDQVLRRLGER